MRHRPPPDNDPLDNGSAAAYHELRRWARTHSRRHRMPYTVFSCGVFYERFAPGGLANLGMGAGCHVQGQGDYMVDLYAARAEIPERNAQGRPVMLCLTSAYDVGRFVAAAIDRGIDTWPTEFRMRGDRVNTQQLVGICGEVSGGECPSARLFVSTSPRISVLSRPRSFSLAFSLSLCDFVPPLFISCRMAIADFLTHSCE